MEFTVEMSCVMKVNRNCNLCRRKVTEVLHCLQLQGQLYSVDFVGDDGSVKFKGRVNPNVMLTVLERYGEHGKVSNLRFDGEVITFRGLGLGGGGYYGQTGYYLPYGTPPPWAVAGNHYYTHPPPPPPRQRGSQHTAPPLPTPPPPPPPPFHSYIHMEPPSWPMGSPEKSCVIM